MARAVWSGSLSFGLVNVPVQLFSATESHQVRFHQVDRRSGERIKYRRVTAESEREIEYEDIVKGYELDDGRLITVTPDEIKAIEPEKTSTIDIEDFVELDEIDPLYWNATYFLGPTDQKGARKPYALLLRAMRETGKVAIGRFVLRNKEYLVTVRPLGEALALETMYFHDEVRDVREVTGAPVQAEVAPREVEMARQLIEALSSPFEPERYHDTYRERVAELLARKAEGEELPPPPAPREPQVIDLMDALRASMESAARHRKATGTNGHRGDGASANGNGKPANGNGLEAMSKEELYERAAKAGVEGRSKMTKADLVAALKERSEPPLQKRSQG